MQEENGRTGTGKQEQSGLISAKYIKANNQEELSDT